MIFDEEKLVKSPLNYTGGKFKLLKQILPLFPEEIDSFVDLFGGGFNVGANINCNQIIYNDKCVQVTQLLEYMYKTDIEEQLNKIDKIIKQYDLSKEHKENYLTLRDSFNKSDFDPVVFYVLICHSFSNQIRFNKKGGFNMPFGDRTFNDILKSKYINFIEAIQNKSIIFHSLDFSKEFEIDTNSFIYIDPPYLNSTATYNENGQWSIEEEKRLFSFINDLDATGIKFALSNNLSYENEFLKKLIEKYNCHYLNHNYNSCNYQKKIMGNNNEILITNY